MWAWDFLFHSMDSNSLSLFMLMFKYPRFDQWEPLRASSCILFIHPYHVYFYIFLHNKMFQASVYFLGTSLESAIFHGALVPFSFFTFVLLWQGSSPRPARRRDFHIGRATVTSLPGYSLLSLATKLYGCFCPKHEGEALRPIFEALCLYSIIFSSYSAWEAFIQHSI